MHKNLSPYTSETVLEARKAMKKHCYYLIPNAYSQKFCDEVKNNIDEISSGLGVEINYEGTETRIWSAQKRFSAVKKFNDESDRFISSVLNEDMKAGTVLAIKNKPLPNQDKKNIKGRWHADSFSSQEKIFLFLSDTTEESGPLEFIPNTHRTFFRFRKVLEPGFFFNPFNILFKKGNIRQYQSIPDAKVEPLFKSGYQAKPILVKAGTVLLIDTARLIHRARPCLSGNRYALTSYYRAQDGYHDYDL